MQQLSRDKFDRFPRATTEFSLCVLDRYGLRDHWPARPTLTPQIRFLYIGSRFCSTLPSDRLTATPLRFAITSPLSGCEEDFHLQAVEHARRTKRAALDPIEGRPELLCLELLCADYFAMTK